MSLSPAEQKEMEALQAGATAPGGASPSALTPDEQAEMAALQESTGGRSAAGSIISHIAQGLNVLPGTTRTLVKEAADTGGGNTPAGGWKTGAVGPNAGIPNQVPTDFGSKLATALQGKAPPSSAMFDALKGHPILGFGADMAMDPTGFVAGPAIKGIGAGVGAIADAGRPIARAADAMVDHASTPISDLLEALGKKIYKSGLKPLDEAAPGTSDILLDNNKWVTNGNAVDKTQKVIDKLHEANSNLAHEASWMSGGMPINLRMAMEPVRERMASLAESPVAAQAVDSMEPTVASYELLGSKSVPAAIKEQKLLRQAAKGSYGEGGSSAPLKAQFYQDMNRGFGNEIGNVLDATPGLPEGTASTYRGNNSKMATLIDARDAAAKMGGKELFSRGDVAAGGLGVATGNMKMLEKYIGAKLALQSAIGPGGKTAIGLALKGASHVPTMDTLLRQGAIHTASPWSLLPPENN